MRGPDFRRFLQEAVPPLVLPVTDPRAGFIYAPGRQLRLDNRAPSPGYYEVVVRGRRATIGALVQDVPQEVLAKQPRISGHAWGSRLVTDQGTFLPISLVPQDNPPDRFAPVVAAAWEDGTVLYLMARFESGIEEAARQVYEEGGVLPAGVPASLLSALGYALLERAGRELGVRWSPLELLRRIPEVAAGGAGAARAVIAELRDRRNLEVARQQEQQRVRDQALREAEVRRVAAETAARNAVERAQRAAAEAARQEAAFQNSPGSVLAALTASGATLLDTRRIGDRLEVRWRFMGERFITTVDPSTLHVLDSGICLQQHDEELTLWSLPSTIREAVQTNVLHITRR